MTTQTFPTTTPIEEMVTKLGVESVFGKPISENGVTIIPVAQVQYGFGYGGGQGSAPNGSRAAGEGTASGQVAEGGGGGGGAGGSAIPRGYVRITPQEVKFEPIMDETRIPLAALVMAAWSVFWIAATIRAIAKVIGKRKAGK